MDCDVIVVGGGPAGLSFARALRGSGLAVVLIERAPLAALAAPGFDGREIALTHASVDILKDLGAWDLLATDEITPLMRACVRDQGARRPLVFDSGAGDVALGHLVPNHAIRRALWDAVEGQAGLRVLAQTAVCGVAHTQDGIAVALSDGGFVRGRLLVAADSRFSETRAALGIAADVRRLGRSMLLCRVDHPEPHGGMATEWFGDHQTLAMLPLAEGTSGLVLTLGEDAVARLMALDDGALARALTVRTEARWGPLRVAGTRHAYPLATAWSHHFAAPRAALIGDAAVGMHPVTAHGFNLGLGGQARLAGLVREAARRGTDVGATGLLRIYEAGHRAVAWPMFTGTNLLVSLYTGESLPARAMRRAGLRLGQLGPVRNGVRALLMAR